MWGLQRPVSHCFYRTAFCLTISDSVSTLNVTLGVTCNGMHSLPNNINVAWSRWVDYSVKGSLTNPVHPDSIFHRVVPDVVIASRLVELMPEDYNDNDNDDNDDMYYYRSAGDEDTHMRAPASSRISSPTPDAVAPASSQTSDAAAPASSQLSEAAAPQTSQSGSQGGPAAPANRKGKRKAAASESESDDNEDGQSERLYIRRFCPGDNINVSISIYFG